MTIAFWIAAYATVINLAAFMAFGWDKRQAVRDSQRISESALLKIAFFGGSIGAKLAQARFRHKTRKQPFARKLNLIVVLQIAIVAGAVLWGLSENPRP